MTNLLLFFYYNYLGEITIMILNENKAKCVNMFFFFFFDYDKSFYLFENKKKF